MPLTQNELIFARNLDEKLQKIENKHRTVYKSADQINNNLKSVNNINNDNEGEKTINNNNNNNNKSLQNLYSGGKNVIYASDRPLFISTVKTGLFLDPPHEIAVLLGLGKGKTSPKDSSNNSLNSSSTLQADDKTVIMYGYSSKPKILPPAKSYHANCGVRQKRDLNNATGKDTNRDGPMPYGNIMYDRRVVRGNTYASHPVPTQQPQWNPYFAHAKTLSAEDNMETQIAKRREARRRAVARRKAKGYCVQGRMGTPPPVKGRKHEPVQTERYLEEIFDRPLETEAATQTDLFLDRPATPPYIPAKVGVDQQTQIYPGELFDFDVEVVPILEVFVGKTIEQALTEVLEEDEIAELQAKQRRFLELRAAEKAEQQRLEEEERRLTEEKDRRMLEHEEGLRLEKETQDRVAATMLSQGYIADLLPNIIEGLKEAGYLVDDIKAEVDADFMPWLMQEVRQELTKMVSSRDVLGEIVRDILEMRAEQFAQNGDHFAGEDETTEEKNDQTSQDK